MLILFVLMRKSNMTDYTIINSPESYALPRLFITHCAIHLVGLRGSSTTTSVVGPPWKHDCKQLLYDISEYRYITSERGV